MKRAVITGMGVVSPLGNNLDQTLESLKNTRSGIKFQEDYAEMGLRSHIAGSIDIDTDELIDRKLRRFMGDAAAFSYIAMQEAINDAGLDEADVSNVRSGIVAWRGAVAFLHGRAQSRSFPRRDWTGRTRCRVANRPVWLIDYLIGRW